MNQEPITALADYATISIGFEVDRVLEVTADERGSFVLSERELSVPYSKDYDAIDGGPERWPDRFDLSNWGIFLVRRDGIPVGGAAVACKTPGLEMLEGRDDLAVLWDIRIQPDLRSRRLGSSLFDAVEQWAAERGCRQLKVETQNINVPANRFYERHHCQLKAANRWVYKNYPSEIQMLWYKDLATYRL